MPSSATPIARSTLIEDPQHWMALKPEWRAIAEACGNGFISPEWFEAWLETSPAARHTAAVAAALDRHGSLVGLLPLVRTDGFPDSLRFGGYAFGDHFDLVASDANRATAAAAIGELLLLGPGGCSTLVLDNVDADTPWWGSLAAAPGARTAAYPTKAAALSSTNLAGLDWEGFLATKSKNFRRELRRKTQRAEDGYALDFRQTGESTELEEDMRTLFRLHGLRWNLRGGSRLEDSSVQQQLTTFAAAALARGWLRLWFLTLDGEPVAAKLCWLLGGQFSSYMGGFDPDYRQHGVGFLLTCRTVRCAIEDGADEFDMLLGDEAWKARFRDTVRPVRTVAIVRSRHPARIAVWAEFRGRRLFDRLPPAAKRRVSSLAAAAARVLPTARSR